MGELERIVREFVPYKDSCCIEDLVSAIRAHFKSLVPEEKKFPVPDDFSVIKGYESGYNEARAEMLKRIEEG